MNKIKVPESVRQSVKGKFEPTYKIVGDTVTIKVGKDSKGKDKFKKLLIQHVGPQGILCNDLETLIPLDALAQCNI